VYGMKKGNLHCFLKLNDASKRLLRTFSRRKKGMAVARKTMVDTIISRLTTVQGYDDIEPGYDEESPSPAPGRASGAPRKTVLTSTLLSSNPSPPRISTLSWAVPQKHRPTTVTNGSNLKVEKILSSIISYSEAGGENYLDEVMGCGKLTFLEKSSSISLGRDRSLLMYKLSLNGESKERIGFLIYQPYEVVYTKEELSKIWATVVGEKVQISIPAHCPDSATAENGETLNDSPLHLSRKLIQSNFGPDNMVPLVIEAEVPLKVVAQEVSRPSLIYSQNRIRSALHFPFHGVNAPSARRVVSGSTPANGGRYESGEQAATLANEESASSLNNRGRASPRGSSRQQKTDKSSRRVVRSTPITQSRHQSKASPSETFPTEAIYFCKQARDLYKLKGDEVGVRKMEAAIKAIMIQQQGAAAANGSSPDNNHGQTKKDSGSSDCTNEPDL